MNDIETVNTQLPSTLPELAKFALVGREKLASVRAEIRAIEKVGLAKEVHEQKLKEAQEIAELVTLAEVQIGKMLREIPKATKGNNPSGLSKGTQISPQVDLGCVKPKSDVISENGLTQRQAEQFQQMAAHPEAVEKAKAEAKENGEVLSRSAVLEAIKQEKKATEQATAEPEEQEEIAVRIVQGEKPKDVVREIQIRPHVVNNSRDDEWYTPEKYIIAARQVLGEIDLDPASNDFANETVKAKTYYTEETDGLSQKWFGNIWMNPPYSTALLPRFAEKLVNESFEQAIVLVNNATETQWFRTFVGKASAIVFHTGRIKFVKRDGEHATPLQGQAFFYYGNNAEKFLEVFGEFGWGAKL